MGQLLGYTAGFLHDFWPVAYWLGVPVTEDVHVFSVSCSLLS